MLGALGAIGGQMLGQIGSSVGSSIGSKITDKIFGVPKVPAPPSGVEAGQWEKDRMDVLFPGTSSWERLGTQQQGGSMITAQNSSGIAQASMKNESQILNKSKMFDFGLQAQSKAMDYENQQRLNDQNNTAMLIAKGADLGPEGVDALVNRYKMRIAADAKSTDFDTPNRRGREELPSKIYANEQSGKFYDPVKPYSSAKYLGSEGMKAGKKINEFTERVDPQGIFGALKERSRIEEEIKANIKRQQDFLNHKSIGPNSNYRNLSESSRRRLGAFGRLFN